MRVLQVISNLAQGGIQTRLLQMMINLNDQDIQFDFLVLNDNDNYYYDSYSQLGAKIFYSKSRKKYFRYLKSLYIFIKLNKYEIIHQHVSSLSNIEPLIIAKILNTEHRIVHSRNTFQGGKKIHLLLHKINKLFISYVANYYYSCGLEASIWLYPKKILQNKNHMIIKNGIIVENYLYNTKIRDQVREQYKLSNKFVIGHIGRVHPQKNHLFLIDIFFEITKLLPNAHLLLIGKGVYSSYISNILSKYNLVDKVLRVEKTDQIKEYLNVMDIFVMPSKYEGLPGSVIEAQDSGLVCLLSDTITSEVKITNLVNFYSLLESTQKWAKKVIDLKKQSSKRKSYNLEIKKQGYDMKDVSSLLGNLYLEMIN
jgi:glycosyltransferase involved in cell wall biosynthesis